MRVRIIIAVLFVVSCSIQDDEKSIKLIQQGNDYLNRKNYFSALLAYQDADQYKLSKETKAKNYRNISICFSGLNERDSAIFYAKKAYESAPDQSYIRALNQAEYFLLLHQEMKALNLLKEIANKNADQMEVHNALSLVYSGSYNEGYLDLNKALYHAKKAYALKANSTNKEQLASVYFLLDNFIRSSELFQELTQEFPEIMLYEFNYGQSLYFMGEEGRGIELMEHAAERDAVCKQMFLDLVE